MKPPKPLVLLFDANPIVNGNKSGVGYYTYNLIQQLAAAHPTDLQLIGHYFNFLRRKDGVELPQAPNISYVQSTWIPGKVLNITRRFGFQLPLELFFKRSGDVALFTNYSVLPSLTHIPRAFAAHDLAYIDHPEYVSKRNREFMLRFVPRSIKVSKLVITISEFSKQTIQKHYGTAAEKIFITPIPPLPPRTDGQLPYSVQGKFILFVSTLEPRKNVINLVKAYEQLPAALKEKYSLVLAGGRGWYIDETMDYIAKLQSTGERIVTTGYITDQEKAGLYKQASLFVMPSHYEGFGMPILEAMTYGSPVAVSDIPVFHEVAAMAAAYFDKDSPEDIAATMQKILTDKALQTKLRHESRQRVKAFNWANVAADLSEQLQRIARR